jgi:hypothetical protein
MLSLRPSLNFRCDGEVSGTPVSVHGDIQFPILISYVPLTKGGWGKRMGSDSAYHFVVQVCSINVELSSKSWI